MKYNIIFNLLIGISISTYSSISLADQTFDSFTYMRNKYHSQNPDTRNCSAQNIQDIMENMSVKKFLIEEIIKDGSFNYNGKKLYNFAYETKLEAAKKLSDKDQGNSALEAEENRLSDLHQKTITFFYSEINSKCPISNTSPTKPSQSTQTQSGVIGAVQSSLSQIPNASQNTKPPTVSAPASTPNSSGNVPANSTTQTPPKTEPQNNESVSWTTNPIPSYNTGFINKTGKINTDKDGSYLTTYEDTSTNTQINYTTEVNNGKVTLHDLQITKNGKLLTDDEVKKTIDSIPDGQAKENFKSAFASKNSKTPSEIVEKKIADDQNKLEDKRILLEQEISKISTELDCPPSSLKDPNLNTDCQTKINSFKVEFNEDFKKYNNSLGGSLNRCNNFVKSTDYFCKITENKTLKDINTGLAASTQVINTVDSAAKVCEISSNVNLIGQAVFTAASLTCGYFKLNCDLSCGRSAHLIKKMDKVILEFSKEIFQWNAKIQKTYSADSLANDPVAMSIKDKANQLNTKVQEFAKKNSEFFEQDAKDLVGPAIAACAKHSESMANLLTQIGVMTLAKAQADDCQRKLSSNIPGSGGGTGQTQTMAEMCAQPANASSSVCKCRLDNTAVGCPGYIAAAGANGNLNKDLNSKGVSNMAGISFGKKITPTGSASTTTDLDNISDEAKKALLANGDKDKDSPASSFAAAGAANAGGGGSTSAGGGAANSKGEKGKDIEEPKSLAGSFVSAVSSLFKGGSGSGSGRSNNGSANDKYVSDKYKEQIKRQIAAEQLRSEISSASGVDNWSKIKNRYKNNASSLIDGN